MPIPRRVLPAALLTLLAMGTTPAVGAAQSAEAFVGSWRLVSMVRPDSAGHMVPQWDKHPAGRLTYTADGLVSAQLYDTRRTKLGVPSQDAPSAAAQALLVGMHAYYGRYTVDTVAKRVLHQVEGAYLPDLLGRTVVRSYRFVGPNRVELRIVDDPWNRARVIGSVLVWERVGR